jgi:hypothetical protein
MWLGDIVYADAPIFAKWRRPATISDVSSEYAIQKNKPEYSSFLARGGAQGRAPIVIGMWDDHDLGVNDADLNVPADFRSASQKLLLDFLDFPADAPQRSRAGVYSAWDLEVERSSDGHRGVRSVPEGGARAPNGGLALRVRIILLDVRSARQPWGGVSHDLLGAAQWAWLERQLQDSVASDAAVTIIGSGIQTIAPGDPPTTEGWGRAPGALARLVALIGATRVRGVVLISGDVHFGELNVAEGASLILGYPLWEFTSSGLTHSWGGIIKGTAVAALLSGATRAALPGGPPWSPFSEDADPEPRSRCSSDVPWRSLAWAAARSLGLAGDVEAGLCFYAGLNFAEIDISPTELRMRLWAEDRTARLIHTLPLAHLAAPPVASEARGAIMAETELWPCAHADLSNGLPPACSAVLSALLPRTSWGAFLRHSAAHAAAALAAAAAVAAIVSAPIIVARIFQKAPALFPSISPRLVQAFVVLSLALFIQFVVAPAYDFLHDALMS